MSNKRNHIDHLTPELIRRYRAGELSAGEQHALEKFLLENPFEAEALEGMELLDQEAVENYVENLNARIEQKANPSTVDKGATEFWAYTRRIAAGVMLLMVSSLAYLWLRPSLDQAPMSNELTVRDSTENKPSAQINREAAQEAESEMDTKASMAPVRETEEELVNPEEVIDKNLLVAENAIEESAPEPVTEAIEEVNKTESAWLDANTVLTDSLTLANSQQYDARLQDFQARQTDEKARLEAEQAQLKLAGTNSRAMAAPPVKAESVEDNLLKSTLAGRQNLDSIAKNELALNNSFVSQLQGTVSGLQVSKTRSISGVVRDGSTGETFPFVNVSIKGTKLGAITDFDGRFSFQADTVGVVLVASFIGYVTKEVLLEGKITDIEIELQEELSDLAEVVVVSDARKSKSKSSSQLALFNRYASENLQYPKQDRKQGVKGRVVLDIEISPAGEVATIKVVRSLGKAFDEEAERLVRAWKGWKPERDKKTGQPKASKQRVKVKFKP